MPHFARNSSLAITWTPQTCHAVRLTVKDDKCAVAAGWTGEIGKDGASLAELLLKAVKIVGGDDAIYIIAGGNGQGWGMADIELPAALKSEELRSALAFELHKQTPLPLDRLRWGYRMLPKSKGAAADRQRIRLVYVKNEYWTSWLKAVDGLGHLDVMLPVPAALDPVLAESAVILPPSAENNARFEYRPAESGRAVIPVSEDLQLTMAQSLPPKFCGMGPLAALPENEQLGYVPAVILGVYGLTDRVSKDAGTLLALPERFRARRNIAAKMTAGVLALYLFGLLVFFLAGSFQSKSAQIRKIETAIKETKSELNALNQLLNAKDTERANLLRQELNDNTPNYPDFPTALLEITRAIESDFWISQSLEWKDGQISFQIQGPRKDLDLASRLEDSSYLGDVSEKQSAFSQTNNSYTQRFELTARFDSQIEADSLRIRQEKLRERERAKAAEEAAAAAEGASGELDDSDDTEPASADVDEIELQEEE